MRPEDGRGSRGRHDLALPPPSSGEEGRVALPSSVARIRRHLPVLAIAAPGATIRARGHTGKNDEVRTMSSEQVRGSSEAADRWLSRLANVAVLAVAVAAAVTLVNRDRQVEQRHSSGYQAGDQLDLVRLRLPGAGFIVVTRSTCSACVASVPFYRLLSGVSMVAVAAESLEANRQFLAKSGVTPLNIIPLEGSGLDVQGVPTLIAVDAGGLVVNQWRRQLSDEQKTRVLSILTQLQGKGPTP